MAGSVDDILASARQRWADYRSGFEPASEQELGELAKVLDIKPAEVAAMVGRLRDDDARANRSELREAQVWLERARTTSKPTAGAFRRYADDAAAARASLKTELASHSGITTGEAASAYQHVITFADLRPTLPMRALADAYITILRALPVDTPREGALAGALYSARDTLGRGNTDTALRATQSSFELAATQTQDMQVAARIHASVLAYSSPEIAAQTTERIFGALHQAYPAVPLGELADGWLAMQTAIGTYRGADHALATITGIVGEKPAAGITGWMRAYATVFRAEDNPKDCELAIAVMAQAPEHLRRDPQALATVYTALLKAEHDASVPALRALQILQRWTPPELDLNILPRVYLTLRGVVGPQEAMARTLYLLERAGTPVRPQVLQRLTDLEVVKARQNRTMLDSVGVAVRELPQLLQGWWERPRGATPETQPRPPTRPKPTKPGTQEPDDDEDDVIEEAPPAKPTDPHPVTGKLPAPIAPATTEEGLALYAPGSVYQAGTPECIKLFESAAALAGLPKEWAKSKGLHNILYRESRNGVVGIPNYTYGTGLSLDDWRRIHTDLKNGVIRAKSSATGLGQLLLRNADVYYPAGREGIGIPLQEAAGMLAYIKDRYGNPDNAWAQYGKRHEGY